MMIRGYVQRYRSGSGFLENGSIVENVRAMTERKLWLVSAIGPCKHFEAIEAANVKEQFDSDESMRRAQLLAADSGVLVRFGRGDSVTSLIVFARNRTSREPRFFRDWIT